MNSRQQAVIKKWTEAPYTYSQWRGLIKFYGSRCYWCQKRLTEQTASRDHLVPLSTGGEDVLANIVPACFPCNSSRGNKSEQEFREYLARKCAKKYKASFFNSVDCRLVQQELREENERSSWAWRNPV